MLPQVARLNHTGLLKKWESEKFSINVNVSIEDTEDPKST